MNNKNVRYSSISKLKDLLKHMTIAIGIKCSNGIVIGSDSQLTYEGLPLKKLGYEKIFEQNFGGNNSYNLAGAGIPAYIYQAHIELYNRCLNNPKIGNILNFKQECESSINAVCSRYIIKRSQDLGLLSNQKNYGVVNLERWQEQIDNLRFELIVGAVFNKGKKAENRLFSVNLNGIAEFIDTYCVIGSGFLFAEYVLSRLYKKEIGLFEAINIIIYVIEEVKKHDPGCGGETKISAIENELGIMPKAITNKIIPKQKKIIMDIDNKIKEIWKEFILNPADKFKKMVEKKKNNEQKEIQKDN